MNKKIILFIIIIALILLLLPKESNELRIRVIANSDSTYDQSVKMEVVNILKKEISKFNKDNIVNDVKNNIGLLDKKISRILTNTEYTIEITKVHFPTKEANGEVIPGGNYQTLLVVIKEGKGKNWWSLLYPDYQNISFEDLDTGEVVFKFYLLEEIKKILSDD